MKTLVNYINETRVDEKALGQFRELLDIKHTRTVANLSHQLEVWDDKFSVEFKEGVNYDQYYKYFGSAKMDKTYGLTVEVTGTEIEFVMNDMSFTMRSGWLEQLKNTILIISGDTFRDTEMPFVIRLKFKTDSDAKAFVSALIDIDD